MKLQVLLVEDTETDMQQFLRDLPAAFEAAGVEVNLHPARTFDHAKEMVSDPSRRYDLILSDTYKGDIKEGDAAVVDLINSYRAGRFCPLIVFSASAKPAVVKDGAFVLWADKAEGKGIERAIETLLATGVPQLARELHDDMDRLAGSYLWEFLEANWADLVAQGHSELDSLRRMLRRRAAHQLAETSIQASGGDVHGFEYYAYPPTLSGLSLGQVLRSRTNQSDVRVVVTPHCYLRVQPGKTKPRAEYVRVVRALPAVDVIGEEKLANCKTAEDAPKSKKLKSWTTPPSGQELGSPEGRYWYLPGFLAIPHSFCDFLRVDSIPYQSAIDDYDSLGVLLSPYAESLQACLNAFDAAVGIPPIAASSARHLLR